jgi:hypothetical protein
MLVTISLTYPSDDKNMLILDIWNIEAPSVAAVGRLVREELGPAMRRYGRRMALEQGLAVGGYCHQALGIRIEETPVSSLEEILADLGDQRGVPLTKELLSRCAKSLHATREPAKLDSLLARHGVTGKHERRHSEGKPKSIPKPQSWQSFDNAPDEPPF